MNDPQSSPQLYGKNVKPEQLLKFLKENHIQYKVGSNSYILECPLCNKKKCYLRKRDGLFVCFVCKNEHKFYGRPEFLFAKLLGLSPSEVARKLYGIFTHYKPVLDIEFTEDYFGPIETEVEETQTDLPAIYFPLDYVSLGDKNFKKGLQYLESRGIGPELIQKYNIKFSPKDNRVIMPVYRGNDLIGWQGRYIFSTEVKDEKGETKYSIPKILTSKGLAGGKYFMFQNNLNPEHVILTEGPFDALKCDMAGGNVAAMGKGVSASQIAVLRQLGPKRLYLGLDPDAGSDTKRLFEELKDTTELYLLEPPKHREDLGDCTPEEVLYQFKQAPRLNPWHIFIDLKRVS